MERTQALSGDSLTGLDWLSGHDPARPSQASALFAFRLARLAYELEPEPWTQAGWRDVSIQMEQRVVPGPRGDGEEGSLLDQAKSAVLPRVARGVNALLAPIAQAREFFGDTGSYVPGKAVTLILPQGDGRFVVAVGFMGTGRRPSDWLVNLRTAHPDGLHEGFAAIANRFLGNAPLIRFPAAQEALEGEEPTLFSILSRCKSPGSPFTFVVAGHSQGAAVTQVFAHRLIRDGVMPEYVAGFGFAPPSPAHDLPRGEAELPVSLFFWPDDPFTRMGLKERLGHGFTLDATDEDRLACYGRGLAEPLMREAMALLGEIRDAGDAFTLGLGYLGALEHRPPRVAAVSLSEFFEGSRIPFLAMPERLVRRILRHTALGLRQSHAGAVGRAPDGGRVAAMKVRLDALMDGHGAVRFTRTLVRAMAMTHSLYDEQAGPGIAAPYAYLVNHAFERLKSIG